MVNPSSDLEHAQGLVATSFQHEGPSAIANQSDKLTRRAGAPTDVTEKDSVIDNSEELLEAGSNMSVNDGTRRNLKARHIQLIGIGGTIGTALYVQIGKSLLRGGPASLFLAFTVWLVLIALFIYCVVSSIFRLSWLPSISGRCVSDSLDYW
jgi:amino acid transporter